MKTFSGILALAAVSVAAAEVRFFDLADEGEEAAFHDAVNRMNLLTAEAFESGVLSPGDGALLDSHILAPGEGNGPFPFGTPEELGLTFQVNTLGGSPQTPSPGDFLYATSDFDAGTIRLGPNRSHHSLDIFLDPPDFRGAVQAFVFTIYSDDGFGEVEVYTPNNVLLGSADVDGVPFGEGKQIGVLAIGDSSIFRVNYWTPNGWTEISDPQVYVIPEPAAVGMLVGLFAIVWCVCRRGRFVADLPDVERDSTSES